jgi:multiple sugar transport system substrate-binding protein
MRIEEERNMRRMRNASGILVAAAMLVASSVVTGPVGAQDGSPDLSGTRVTLLIHPTLYGAIGGDEGIVKEFQDATGATVEVVTADINEYIAQARLEFAAGSGRYDVIAMENSHLSGDVLAELADLAPFIEAAPAGWAYDDFPESLKDPVTDDTGKVSGIPFRFAANAFYYRPSLFEAAGVAAPATFDEMLAVGQALKEAGDVTPFMARGVPVDIVHDWLALLYGHGGQVLSDDFSTCVLTEEPGIAATTLFGTLFEQGLIPEDLFAVTRDEYIARMQRGDAAAGIYYAPYWGRMVNPEESQVVDDMGYALQPVAEGVEPGRTRAAGWYMAVADDSQNKDAAWALVETITSPENLLRGALEWANAPVRLSTYADAAFVELFPVAGVWSDALAASVTDPAVPGWPRMVDILGEELVAAIRGDKTPDEAMAAACQRIDEVNAAA